MALLDRVRERTGSDLSDTELTAMIAGITAELDARFGPAGAAVQTFGDLENPEDPALTTLRLTRPLDAGQAVTIREERPGNAGTAALVTTLQAGDYRVLHGGRTLQRLTGGPNGQRYWAPFVSVTYTPIGEAAARDEAVIKLAQLDLTWRGGLKMERAGDYHFTLADNFADEREAIMNQLAQRRGLVMA